MPPRIISALAVAAWLGATLTLSRAQDAPQELRQRAAQLEEQIPDLKASGQQERAMRLAREVEELRAQAAQRQERLERARRDRPPEEQQELRRERRRLMAEMEELQRNGRRDAAAELRVRIAELSRELGEPIDRSPRPQPPEAPDRPRWDGPPPGFEAPFGDPEARERRRHHLEVAIDNLRAAGMPELAERLQQQLAQIREPRTDFARPELVMERVGAELQRLRAEMEELRQNLRELREQVSRGPR